MEDTRFVIGIYGYNNRRVCPMADKTISIYTVRDRSSIITDPDDPGYMAIPITKFEYGVGSEIPDIIGGTVHVVLDNLAEIAMTVKNIASQSTTTALGVYSTDSSLNGKKVYSQDGTKSMLIDSSKAAAIMRSYNYSMTNFNAGLFSDDEDLIGKQVRLVLSNESELLITVRVLPVNSEDFPATTVLGVYADTTGWAGQTVFTADKTYKFVVRGSKASAVADNRQLSLSVVSSGLYTNRSEMVGKVVKVACGGNYVFAITLKELPSSSGEESGSRQVKGLYVSGYSYPEDQLLVVYKNGQRKYFPIYATAAEAKNATIGANSPVSEPVNVFAVTTSYPRTANVVGMLAYVCCSDNSFTAFSIKQYGSGR